MLFQMLCDFFKWNKKEDFENVLGQISCRLGKDMRRNYIKMFIFGIQIIQDGIL